MTFPPSSYSTRVSLSQLLVYAATPFPMCVLNRLLEYPRKSVGEAPRVFELGVDDEFAGTGHKSPATIHDYRVKHLGGGAEGQGAQDCEGEQQRQP